MSSLNKKGHIIWKITWNVIIDEKKIFAQAQMKACPWSRNKYIKTTFSSSNLCIWLKSCIVSTQKWNHLNGMLSGSNNMSHKFKYDTNMKQRYLNSIMGDKCYFFTLCISDLTYAKWQTYNKCQQIHHSVCHMASLKCKNKGMTYW